MLCGMTRRKQDLRDTLAVLAGPSLAPWWVGIVTFGVVLIRLFVPSAVALADNGEGARLMCRFGVTATTDGAPAAPFVNAETTYLPVAEPADCGAWPTSTAGLVHVARFLGYFTGHQGLDLSVVVALYAVAVGIAAGLLWWLLAGSWLRRLVAVALLVLVAADSTFAVFPGSAYTDTAGVFGLVLLAPVLVLLADPSRGRRVRTRALVVTALLGAFTVAARPSAATIAIPLAAYLLWLGWRARPSGRGARAWLAGPAAYAGAAAVVAAAAIGTAQGAADQDRSGPTNLLFSAVLAQTDDPVDTLEDLGLPPVLASQAGETWWTSGALQREPALVGLTRGDVVGYLVRHPGTALGLADATASHWLAARPANLGNFLPEAGLPNQKDCRLCLWSGVLNAFQGLGLVTLALGFALVAAAGRLALVRRRSPTVRALVEVAFLMLAVSAVQLLTVMVGQGTDVTRHLVLSLLAGGLALVLVCAAGVAGAQDRAHPPLRRRPVPQPVAGRVTEPVPAVAVGSISAARAAWESQVRAWLETPEEGRK